MKIDKTELNFFQANGYLVIRDVIPLKKINEIRDAFKIIRQKAKKAKTVRYNPKYPDASFILGDLPSFKELEPFDFLVCNKKIVEIVKSLIGNEIVYFGESNTQSGLAIRGNHKDSRVSDREDASGLDWQGDYPLVRVGIYLNDSDIYSGGLKVMPGSHKIPTSHFKLGGVNVDVKAGDLVIWKLTTTHSGNAKRLKLFHKLSFHPKIEDIIPKIFERKNPLERMAMFVVYGAKSEHLNRYVTYFGKRPDTRVVLGLAGTSDIFVERARLAGIDLFRPINDYGVKLMSTGFQFE